MASPLPVVKKQTGMTGTLKGFSAPLDPTGQSVCTAPSWNFSGRSVTLIVDCDQRAIAKLVQNL